MSKPDIVKLLLSYADIPDPWKEHSIDQLVFQWFATGRTGSGLRLSESGMQVFNQLDIAYYSFPMLSDTKDQSKVYLSNYIRLLDKKLFCPYYVGIEKGSDSKKLPYIRIYDHKIAMMISLYGNISDYIDTIK